MAASRDERDLYRPLRERWRYLRKWWREAHPDAPEPFLTATYRHPGEQLDLMRQGLSRAGPGQSLHNYQPAYAFDVAFRRDNTVPWSEKRWWRMFGRKAEEIGLEWGGSWREFPDPSHIQMPMTWRQARDREVPPLPPLPETARTHYGTLVVHEGAHPIIIRRPYVMTIRGEKVDIRFTDQEGK